MQGQLMDLIIQTSYNLDVLNLLNILTGDPAYTNVHPDVYMEFNQALSQESRDILSMVTDALGNGMISPLVAFALSFVTKFEDGDLLALLLDEERILSSFKAREPRMLAQAGRLLPLFRLLAPVVEEIEELSFHDYWTSENLPLIIKKKEELEHFIDGHAFEKEIVGLLGKNHLQDHITIFLCALAAPYGIKISGNRYITDASYDLKTIFAKALRELLQTTVDQLPLKDVLKDLADDPFIILAFERKDPKYGAQEVETYLRESILEAMALFISHKTGLDTDPYDHLLQLSGGSFVFSVILLDFMQTHPKELSTEFSDYFMKLIDKMPLGNLATAYQAALEHAGKNPVN
jgi:hypothetical protein